MKRIALLCPGRGSYTEKTLRSLPEGHPWVTRADELRAEYGLPSLVALDRADKFSPPSHLLPANVSPLIYLVSMLDCAAAMQEHKAVCVAGNSLGWYTALAVAGALDFDDGFRLVQEMSLLQHEHQAREKSGGQVIEALVDDAWRPVPALRAAVYEAIRTSNGQAFRSIDLGGLAVLAGTEEGVAHLLKSLPKVKVGNNQYPFRLMQHGPYHTPLVQEVATKARAQLARLAFRAPRVTLIDGRGARFTPWSTDVSALVDYTLGAQITTPYDFALSVRVALREYAPDHLVAPGPGNSLGGVIGQILIAEGWRGIRERADFDRVQQSEKPVLVSMRR
ncbi:MAG: ACP S-malonyltransferase [Planctomycetota bacterium]